jgi:serine O-acetyltransferase
MIRSDIYREFGGFSIGLLLSGFSFRRSLRPIISLRFCQAIYKMPRPYVFLFGSFARAIHRMTCSMAGVDLPWKTQIGPGFLLTHGWGLVVSPGAKIGRNVTLFHGVTLGQRDRISSIGKREIGYPTIEDDVWIGPHAIIVGQVTIGRGSRIAGGAYIYESVEPYSIMMGNPAKVVKKNCTPDVPNCPPH